MKTRKRQKLTIKVFQRFFEFWCEFSQKKATDLNRSPTNFFNILTVNINKLLNVILASKIPKYTKRWLCSYLQGRQTYVEFRNAKSTLRKVRAGVPQGGVLSPILFNAYMSGLPTAPDGIKLTSYANDCTSYASGPTIPPICEKLNS